MRIRIAGFPTFECACETTLRTRTRTRRGHLRTRTRTRRGR
jgi:hypothetical protein